LYSESAKKEDKMKKGMKKTVIYLFLSIFLLCAMVVNVSGEEYEALQGLKSIKAVFDFRTGNPQSALLPLKLIHDTFKDKNITAITKKPAFKVVFLGPAVKLVSTNKESFSADEKKILDEIAQTITAMSKEGIRFEICMVAVKVFGVEASSILPEIKQVHNGWISLIGYQAKGYSLVPVY
jgi:intracellular sulfur oxidation DsrE/DsrF family protein